MILAAVLSNSQIRSQILELELHAVTQIRTSIEAAYHHGNVIIVGRGGQVVLTDKPDVLHVRIVAPAEKRIARWQARNALSYAAARDLVHERDKAHIEFVRDYFDADINEPTWYDLVINTNKITPEDAARIICDTLDKI